MAGKIVFCLILAGLLLYVIFRKKRWIKQITYKGGLLYICPYCHTEHVVDPKYPVVPERCINCGRKVNE